MEVFSPLISPFSHIGVLIGGTLLFFILGWLWHSPITSIGKIWVQHFPYGKDAKSNGVGIIPILLLQIFMGLIVTYIVMIFWLLFDDLKGMCNIADWSSGHICDYIVNSFYRTVLIVKILVGLIFIKDLGHWFFEKRPFSLVLIGTGYYLVGVLGVCLLFSYFL